MVEVQNNNCEGVLNASTELQPKPQCPDCGSYNINRNGFRQLKDKTETQVFKCKECGQRFSENYYRCKGQHGHANYALSIEAKKLDNVTENKTVTSDKKDINGKLLEFHIKMKLQGYKDTTIRLNQSVLNTLMTKGADLTNPESVKQVISQQSWSGSRIRNACVAYTAFLKYIGLTWEQPIYTIIRKKPFIPTEEEIDALIAASPNPLATFLQLLKETAMRRGEAIQVPLKDVDLTRRIIMCNKPEKGSNARIFSELSEKLLNMLRNLPRENDLLFGTATEGLLKNQLCRTREKLAFKLGNPRLKDIHFHTLRHWKATMFYHYKPDILETAEFLGHKDIKNTQLYVQIEKNLFKNLPNDQFITKVAHNTEESCKLIEVGFEYVTGEYNDGGKIFRKRK